MDLLFYDMGDGLVDNLGEGEVMGCEWWMVLFWGIGLMSGVSGGEVYFYDGCVCML